MSKKILICDDDEGILELLVLVLEDEGFEVIAEQNSLNIYKLIERERPDLILLDMWMPVLSGDQILKTLKKNPETQDVPVIIISASTEGKRIADAAGANHFISKPFDVDNLVNSISGLI